MSTLKPLFKKHYFFLLILLVALILRIYRLDYLTTFGRDQGIDFLSIRDMIINHKLTLIGIKVSIADFFQGPVYLYMLAPIFYLMKLDPLAGAFTSVFLSLLTLLTLYYVIYKIFNIRAAIIATSFFAVSPQLVMFGNTPLYQNFTPLFILLGVWSLYRGGDLFIFLSGLFVGIGMELHFLVISLMLTIFIYLLTHKNIKSIAFYFLGLLVSASPTTLFEVRHNFLNLHLLLNYFGTSHTSSSFFSVWIERISYFATHDYNFLIVASLLLTIYIFLTRKYHFSKDFIFFKKLALINFLIIFLFALKLSSFGTH